ncbi:MAG: DUF177 domain-containing protein [Syntrophaceae bacterium]|nr:DUF177 domain-containing protein [Syntrophaceae bacterium]
MINSLKINVVTIPEEGRNFVFSGDGKWFQESFPNSDEVDFSLQKVDVTCQITKASSTVFIKGSISAIIGIACSRCLEDASLTVGGDFAYTLVPLTPETREDLELQAEDLEVSSYQGDFIDLAPIIYEQIILQIPLKPLCSEDCKGLCPHCGTNLNVASCNCGLEIIDDRLAVLKKFKIKH